MRRSIQLNSICATAAVLTGAFASATAAQAGQTPIGVWLDDKGRGAIEIKQCGRTLCGHVVWVKNTKDTKGCGRKMIGKVRQISKSRWDGGWIYSPERRKTYDVELRPLKSGNLRVTGYAGTKLFSRTMIWKPAPADLVRCGDKPAVSAKAKPAAEKPAAKTTAAATDLPDVTVTQNAETAPGENDTSTVQADTGSARTGDQPESVTRETNEDDAGTDVASNDAASFDDDSEGPPTGREEGLDLGKLGLDKFLKRTESGKCKLDLPWVKVNFDCDR